MLGMSDRVVVIREGRVSSVFDIYELTQEQVLAAALPDYDLEEEMSHVE